MIFISCNERSSQSSGRCAKKKTPLHFSCYLRRKTPLKQGNKLLIAWETGTHTRSHTHKLRQSLGTRAWPDTQKTQIVPSHMSVHNTGNQIHCFNHLCIYIDIMHNSNSAALTHTHTHTQMCCERAIGGCGNETIWRKEWLHLTILLKSDNYTQQILKTLRHQTAVM